MTTIIKVRWVIIKDNKIFLVRDSESWNFILPWWKQEFWENIKDTFYREMLEETWVKAEIDKFIWFKEYIAKNWNITIQFLFKVKNIDDFENIDKDKCSHWYEWRECWFYSLEYLKSNNYDIPQDLEQIINIWKNTWEYNYFI